MSGNESQAVTRRRGKWSQAGVPHKGWSCIGTEDLGPDQDSWQTCEMCEAMAIRYVHSMSHPDYSGELGCGCVCAGHMEQDLQAARGRETALKKSVKQRQAFPRRREWRVSQKGNPWIQFEGWNITIFPRGGRGFGGVASRGEQKLFLQQLYPTADEAKLAAYDLIRGTQQRAG